MHESGSGVPLAVPPIPRWLRRPGLPRPVPGSPMLIWCTALATMSGLVALGRGDMADPGSLMALISSEVMVSFLAVLGEMPKQRLLAFLHHN